MGELRLDVLSDPDQLVGLREEWHAALAADTASHIFSTWEWVHTWWVHFGVGHELHVLVVRDDDGIAAIGPFQRVGIGGRPLGVRVLERTNPQTGDYGGVVVARRPVESVELIVDHLEQMIGERWATLAVISRLCDDDPLLSLLRDAVERRRARLSARFVTLVGACPYTDLRAGIDRNRRERDRDLARRLRRLAERHGDVEFAYRTGDAIDEGLEQVLQVHALRWAGRESAMRGLLAEPGGPAFLRDAVRALDARGAVKLLTLTAGGSLVAAELAFCHHRRLTVFKGGFDPAFAAFAPGQLVFHQMLADARASGDDVVDWGRGDEAYKAQWATGRRQLVTVTLTRSGVAGRLDTQRTRAARAQDRWRRRSPSW